MKKIKIALLGLTALMGVAGAFANNQQMEAKKFATVRYVRSGSTYIRISEASYLNDGTCVASTSNCSYLGSDAALTKTTYTVDEFDALIESHQATADASKVNFTWQHN